MAKVKVLIVDDSILIRDLFTEVLSEDPAIEVVGAACDAYDAREKIKELNPDVITLDIEMPKMDGISFLEKIMSLRPMPVVMVSSLTQKGANATFRALEIGAVDYVPKSSSREFDVDNLKSELIEKIKAASKAKVVCPPNKKAVSYNSPPKLGYRKGVIVALGASTGGVEAIRDVITSLPENIPPIVITQHMPEKFTATFAERLNKTSKVTVYEAVQGQKIEQGCVYIAPGGYHLMVKGTNGNYFCSLGDDLGKVSGHMPSVDVMFESVAKSCGGNAVGVILTGMGRDGAKGMLEMKKAGCVNIGQDEASSVVYGMPKAAYMAGAVDEVVSLNDVAKDIIRLCSC